MLDPMTLMMLASKANPGGAGDPLLNPAGSMPIAPTAAMGAQSPGFQAGSAPAAPSAPGQSLGDMLKGVQAPQGAEPKFSGGVSGSGLPYVSRIEDMVSPFLQASGAGKQQMMPTLGMLLSQAPGGGR